MEAQYAEKLEGIKLYQLKEQYDMRKRIFEERNKKIKKAEVENKDATEVALESLETEYEERIYALECDLSWKKKKVAVELAIKELRLQNKYYRKSMNENESKIEFV